MNTQYKRILWISAECDVPLRHGWFYHKEELFSIYLKSVGRGTALDLGLAPMPAEQLHSNDVKSLLESFPISRQIQLNRPFV